MFRAHRETPYLSELRLRPYLFGFPSGKHINMTSTSRQLSVAIPSRPMATLKKTIRKLSKVELPMHTRKEASRTECTKRTTERPTEGQEDTNQHLSSATPMAHKPPQNHRQPTQLLGRISLSTARNRSPNLSSHSSHSWYSVSTHGFPQEAHSTVPSTGLQILAFCPQSSVRTGPCSISAVLLPKAHFCGQWHASVYTEP